MKKIMFIIASKYFTKLFRGVSAENREYLVGYAWKEFTKKIKLGEIESISHLMYIETRTVSEKEGEIVDEKWFNNSSFRASAEGCLYDIFRVGDKTLVVSTIARSFTVTGYPSGESPYTIFSFGTTFIPYYIQSDDNTLKKFQDIFWEFFKYLDWNKGKKKMKLFFSDNKTRNKKWWERCLVKITDVDYAERRRLIRVVRGFINFYGLTK